MIYRDKKELIEDLVHANDVVLDVGFWGQGVQINDKDWVHNLILNISNRVYGIDINYNDDDVSKINSLENYRKGSAENLNFETSFDIIFAGDLIEHLSNCGLFIEACKSKISDRGKLILTTPNCFNLFNLAEKITKSEPTVNHDHVCYFNSKTIIALLNKNGFYDIEIHHLYSLNIKYKESTRKKFLNVVYFLLSKFSPKFIETLVVVAKKR